MCGTVDYAICMGCPQSAVEVSKVANISHCTTDGWKQTSFSLLVRLLDLCMFAAFSVITDLYNYMCLLLSV